MAGIFESLARINLFQDKKKSVLGIDIGSSAIKIVQLKKKKGVAVLETYGELSLGPYSGTNTGRATSLSAKDMSQALVDLLKESRADIIDCGVSIPLGSSLITAVEMPNLAEKELVQMVPIEARKYVPFPMSEVVLEWRIIPQRESTAAEDISLDKNPDVVKGKIDILIAAIHNEAIEKQKQIIKGAGLNLKFWELEIFSTIRSSISFELSSVALLDIGAGISKLYIIERGVVRSSHIIDRGSQNITLAIASTLGIDINSAEKKKYEVGANKNSQDQVVADIVSLNLEHIFDEANRSIINYQKKFNRNISKLVLTGGGSVVKDIIGLASSIVETDVSIADPFSRVETPAFLGDVLKEAGPGFAVAIGLALRGLDQME